MFWGAWISCRIQVWAVRKADRVGVVLDFAGCPRAVYCSGVSHLSCPQPFPCTPNLSRCREPRPRPFVLGGPCAGVGGSPVPISPRPFFQAVVKGRRLWAQKTPAGAARSSAVWHQANRRTSLRLSLLTSTVEMAVVMPVERHRGARRADRGTARVFSPRRLRRAARPDPFTQVRVEVVRA